MHGQIHSTTCQQILGLDLGKFNSVWCIYEFPYYEGAVRSIDRVGRSGSIDNWLGDNGWSDVISSPRPCPA